MLVQYWDNYRLSLFLHWKGVISQKQLSIETVKFIYIAVGCTAHSVYKDFTHKVADCSLAPAKSVKMSEIDYTVVSFLSEKVRKASTVTASGLLDSSQQDNKWTPSSWLAYRVYPEWLNIRGEEVGCTSLHRNLGLLLMWALPEKREHMKTAELLF